MGVYDQVKKALQDVVAPELREIWGGLVRLDGRIDAIESRLESLRSELNGRIDGLEARIAALDMKIGSLEREIRVSMEFRERLAAIEAKLGIFRG